MVLLILITTKNSNRPQKSLIQIEDCNMAQWATWFAPGVLTQKWRLGEILLRQLKIFFQITARIRRNCFNVYLNLFCPPENVPRRVSL